jgi:hypothetical protein
MKASGKRTAKLSSRSNGKLKTAGRNSTKTASGERAAKQAAKKSSKKRRTIKSTVPPQFRAMPKMDAKDPRFWELREQFKNFYKSLPEEEVDNFVKGLKRPFLDYLVNDLAREQHT